ncbi:hypothetical protein [Brucella sp. JSBI001]|uniref:hypothetical protein n=1 Tax=Brucella sp. JSBI001 TaxID=2886044 RepID=UPI00124F4B08|nr:hypothetical protein [Brucella sp. JSBI001]KAB2669067.1 hypothetical protein F9K77_15810 [Ochrobactrum sp. LMG 5442]UZD69106.1 hypothetical protein LJ361_18620 [Brucella sp. JSBI001]
MTEINWWLETYKLIPASLIGVSVVVVAYLQWKTAHTKVMVDLFDKRLVIYENVLKAITLSNMDDGSGQQTKEATFKLYRARSDATFLFGDEIASIVHEIITCMSTERRNNRRLDRHNLSNDDRERLAEEAEQAGNRKDRLGRQFQAACIPYLRIQHKGADFGRTFSRRLKVPPLIICIMLIFWLLFN